MAYAALRSIGAYAPSKILTNDDLAKMVDTSDEWIAKRTGIKERRIAAKDETTSDIYSYGYCNNCLKKIPDYIPHSQWVKWLKGAGK